MNRIVDPFSLPSHLFLWFWPWCGTRIWHFQRLCVFSAHSSIEWKSQNKLAKRGFKMGAERHHMQSTWPFWRGLIFVAKVLSFINSFIPCDLCNFGRWFEYADFRPIVILNFQNSHTSSFCTLNFSLEKIDFPVDCWYFQIFMFSNESNKSVVLSERCRANNVKIWRRFGFKKLGM